MYDVWSGKDSACDAPPHHVARARDGAHRRAQLLAYGEMGMEREPVKSDRPSVVPRGDIPLSTAPEDGEIDVRPFDAHAVLGSALPPSGVSLAFTEARHGQDVGLRSHAVPGLLIILEGAGELNGAVPRMVQQGDVITIPAHHAYGFR